MAHPISSSINADRSVCVTHTFHVVLGIAKACLLPFLTLFFRQLGLTATQTGLLFGVHAWVTMWFGPFWTKCAKCCNKKKGVLMVVIFLTMGTYLSMTAIPPAQEASWTKDCHTKNNSSLWASFVTHSKVNETRGHSNPNYTDVHVSSSTIITTLKSSVVSTKPALAIQTAVMSSSTLLPTESTAKHSNSTSPTPTPHPVVHVKETSSTVKTWPTKQHQQTVKTWPTKQHQQRPTTTLKSIFDWLKTTTTTKAPKLGVQDMQFILDMLSPQELDSLAKVGLTKEVMLTLTPQDLEEIIAKASKGGFKHRRRRDLFASTFDSITAKLRSLKEKLGQIEQQTFIITMALFILAAIFSAPVEKLADDIWFHFLDSLDWSEKYGYHWIWLTAGFIVFPPILGLAVDYTPCLMLGHVHHFMLHFYLYAGFMGVTFITAVWYPVATGKSKVNSRGGLIKGMKILFSDCHSITFTLTAILMGFLYACPQIFVYWKVMELHGSEVVVGCAVATAAASEITVLVVHRGFLRKITHAGAVILALVVTAVRLVYYSFLWTPWVLVPAEIVHGLTLPLMWCALKTYPDFRVNPHATDRSALSVINGLYVGVGVAFGSITSGVLYDKIGYMYLFQAASIVAFVWALFFGLIQKCKKKAHKVRYAKLLQSEEDGFDSAGSDDDWLEVAMKTDGKYRR